jgi:RNA polymerase sigma factor FliA
MSTNVFNPNQPELVIANYFSLVQAIARRIKRRLPAHVDVQDLVQTGVIALLEASGRYDVSREVDFSTYAHRRITGAILDELRKFDPCSRHDRKQAREAEKAKGQLRAATGTEPSREEVAAAVGVGLAEYEGMLQRLECSKHGSSYSREEDDAASDQISRLPSKDESPHETYTRKEEFQVLKTYMKQLKPRHQQVLRLYYFKEMGLRQIGERLGVGEARICQIQKQALAELRRLIEIKRTPAPVVNAMIQ